MSPANSLVGSTAGDQVGYTGTENSFQTTLSNGSYIVKSSSWHNGAVNFSGAITFGGGADCTAGPTVGVITPGNSVLGTAQGGGSTMNSAYDPVNHQIVVSRPADNIVTLFVTNGCTRRVFLPAIAQ